MFFGKSVNKSSFLLAFKQIPAPPLAQSQSCYLNGLELTQMSASQNCILSVFHVRVGKYVRPIHK